MLALRSHTLQSSAALRTGTRVEKINSKHGDSQVNGAHGTNDCELGVLAAAFSTVQNPPARKMDWTNPDADSPAGIGKTAAQFLMRLLEGRDAKSVSVHRVQSHLVVRASTAMRG